MAVFLKCLFQAAFTEIVADASPRGLWLLFSGITRFLPNPPIHSTSLLSFLQVVGSNPETAEKKVYLLVRATTQKSFYSLSDVLSFELQPWPQDLINSIMLVRCVKLKYYRVSEVESVKLQRILRMFKKKFRVFC